MPIVTVTMSGDREVAATLDSAPPTVLEALRAKVMALTLKLQRKVKVEYLSGPTGAHTLSVGKNTPGHTGGQLRSSVFQELTASSFLGVFGRVGYSADVPYAGIHEFGGHINVPEMVPVKAQALHWVAGGKDVFAKRTRAHVVTMPERAPLRTAFGEMNPEIREGLKDAVSEGIANARGSD